eukprot:SAG31_NODE_28599_length_407_cov_4.357143_1_plen_20_part_01
MFVLLSIIYSDSVFLEAPVA